MPTNAKICSSPLATLATLAISCPRYFSLFSVFLFSFASISGAVCAFYFTTRLTWPSLFWDRESGCSEVRRLGGRLPRNMVTNDDWTLSVGWFCRADTKPPHTSWHLRHHSHFWQRFPRLCPTFPAFPHAKAYNFYNLRKLQPLSLPLTILQLKYIYAILLGLQLESFACIWRI